MCPYPQFKKNFKISLEKFEYYFVRIKVALDEIEKRILEDLDVVAKDSIVLQKEVKILKQKILKLEAQHIS